jgi:amino acid transporter
LVDGRQPWAALWVAAGCLLAGLVTWLALAPAQVEQWMGESGPVERVTAATYALSALAVWALRHRDDDWRTSLALCTLMAAFSARELDAHKAFTGTSVLRLSWYGGPASPLAKALAALVIIALLLAMVWLVIRHARGLRRRWRQRQPVAITLFVFIAVLAVAKGLDRSVSILVFDLQIGVPLHWKALRTALEEWLELGLSMLLLLGLLQHRAAVRARTMQPCALPTTSSSRLPSRSPPSR